MRISKTLQTPDGEIHFDGELSEEEYERVFEFGLVALHKMGAIPFTQINVEDIANVMPTNGETH